MSERWKQILFAVAFVGISAGMGYVVYLLLFRGPQVRGPKPSLPQELTGTFPQAGPGKPSKETAPGGPELPFREGFGALPSAEVSQPTLAPRTQLLRDGVTQALAPSSDKRGARFYNPEDGRFYRVSPDGAVRALGEKQFFNVETVRWAHTKDETIMEFPDGSKLFYDFERKQQVNLPSHWQDFDFSPSDDRVAAKSMGVDQENRFLILTNPDGTEAKAIEPLGDNADKLTISWSPAGQIVGYTRTGDPQSGTNEQILFIGQNHENFKSIIAPGQGFLANWSPNGKQILYSVWTPDTENRPSLWMSSGEPTTMGANRKNLSLRTWADKCVWAGDTDIFCAVPQDLPPNAGLLRAQFTTLPDDVYHIDLSVGSAVKLNAPDQRFPVQQPVVNAEKTKFIFTDAVTGKLYSYDIK